MAGFLLDGGYIGSDNELKKPFPDLEGGNLQFRRFEESPCFGTLYDWMEFKFSMDFANVRDVKDNGSGLRRYPTLDTITLGHMKESFSIEQLTSLENLTFMERALPTVAFAAG